MRLFAAIGKKIGESVARFEPTEITNNFHPPLQPLGLADDSYPLINSPAIFRVKNGLMAHSPLSPNLLFEIPSAESLTREPFQFHRTHLSNLKVQFDEPLTSEDLVESLTPAQVSRNLISRLLFENAEEVGISENLFRPLLPQGARGKNYRKKAEAQPSLFGSVRPKTDGFAKAYSRQKGMGTSASYQTQSLSFWDLLLPVLMPPVNTKFGRQFELPHTLYKFQPKGIEFLVKNESALLADEMGTGKTVMSAVALKILFRLGKVKKALIVCPVSLLRTWQDHLQEWAGELQLTVVRGTPEVRKLDWKYPAHIYLTTYDTLASDFLSKIKKEHRFDCPKCKVNIRLGTQLCVEDDENPILSCPNCDLILNDFLLKHSPRKGAIVDSDLVDSFDAVLIDEAQYIKNKTSQRSRAVRLIKPRYRWALTGTPIENRLDDLFAIFSFVKPELFKGLYDVGPRQASQLIKPHFLRRLKKDVMKDLPPKVKQEMWLDLDADQRRAYNEAERQGIHEIENMASVSRVHIFALISKLKQLCNFAPGKSISPKTEELIDLVEQIKQSGQKVLVFSQYDAEGVNKLEKLLRPYGVSLLKGGLSDAARNAAINNFKRNKNICVLLATIKTGGVGLTLTEASYVIHFDHWWNPALMWQADDRVHRSGQKSSQVNIYSFWTQRTIEERIHSVLKEKQLLFDEVINGLSVADIDEKISIDEWLNILGVKPKTKSADHANKNAPPRSENRSNRNTEAPPPRQQRDESSRKSSKSQHSSSGRSNTTGESNPKKGFSGLINEAYKTLGVQVGADSVAIMSAYKKLAKIYHPDKVAGATASERRRSEEKMKDINAAYQFLKKNNLVK